MGIAYKTKYREEKPFGCLILTPKQIRVTSGMETFDNYLSKFVYLSY